MDLLDFGRGGAIVNVDLDHADGWVPVVKLDLFGSAHWHLYRATGQQSVHSLPSHDSASEGLAILADLAGVMSEAGYEAAASAWRAAGLEAEFVGTVRSSLAQTTGRS